MVTFKKKSTFIELNVVHYVVKKINLFKRKRFGAEQISTSRLHSFILQLLHPPPMQHCVMRYESFTHQHTEPERSVGPWFFAPDKAVRSHCPMYKTHQRYPKKENYTHLNHTPAKKLHTLTVKLWAFESQPRGTCCSEVAQETEVFSFFFHLTNSLQIRLEDNEL